MYPQQNNPPVNNPNAYDFIVNPQAAPRRSVVASGSKKTRIIIVAIGLILLLVLFMIVKGLLSSDNGNYSSLVHVVSEQREILHVVKGTAVNSTSISDSNLNIAITTELSLTSGQSQLVKYLGTQGHKVNSKQLLYPGAAAIDKQLAASVAAGTYDETFHQVLKTQLTEYQLSLKQAYTKTTGAKGRELLTQQYTGVTLLLRQLGTS